MVYSKYDGTENNQVDQMIPEIAELYLVRLTRRGGYIENSYDIESCGIENDDVEDGGEDNDRFYSFDYFDQLLCTKMSRLTTIHPHIRPYVYFSEQSKLFENGDYPVLSHLLVAMIEFEGDDYKTGDPFNSTMPFFSLILVNKKAPVLSVNSRSGSEQLGDIDLSKVVSCKVSNQSGSFGAWKMDYDEIVRILPRGDTSSASGTLIKILYPMNAGDFIIAVRSDKIETAYNLAIRIREKTNNRYETFTTSSISYTFLSRPEMQAVRPKAADADISGGSRNDVQVAYSRTQIAVRLKVEDSAVYALQRY
ncbi:MAG: hypothetical protein LBL49_08705 [Clostridiales Family XIII bacterium]|jgi:hypothetical protein|nr:hypothetical protein [Clostridiales Family XIII bacterium]